jgi:hypothetical protein
VVSAVIRAHRKEAADVREEEGTTVVRKLTDHIVEGDSANHQLTIRVADEAGAGWACHLYEISGWDSSSNASDPFVSRYGNSGKYSTILFQNGPIKEVGVNGVTGEALLAIVIDRLRSFQAGPYACEDNAVALAHCEKALYALQGRTRKRIARGVEGTHEK